MSKRHKKRKGKRPKESPLASEPALPTASAEELYDRACRLAERGEHERARAAYELLGESGDGRLKALIRNDLAALSAVRGDLDEARAGFHAALAADLACAPARANLACLEEAGTSHPEPVCVRRAEAPPSPVGDGKACKVAVVSFLFNWPSTGGGIVHTVELAQFLARAGYEVKHFYARHEAWGVGRVEGRLPFPSEPLDFDERTWDVPHIQQRYRGAVDAFAPDYVLLTDSWNMKPLLAEALAHYPYFLRLQAMECLCPLNNVRFLPEAEDRFRQCRLHQLAHPRDCARCLQERGHQSGALHQAERALSGAGTPAYHERLLRAVAQAEAVLAVNPLTAAMIAPYARAVHVVTAGMDPTRFPWPWPGETSEPSPRVVRQLFFAGLVEERIKGFHVAQEACALLWRKRRDFELVATGDPPGRFNEFTRFVGWLSQADLPRHLRAADMLLMPTIAQEALGRTAVEAMAVGRPVVASRLGGLPFTVSDGVTGLLFDPGSAEDLARKVEALLDDDALGRRLGLTGRRRFEEEYSWDVIIERHYRPLLVARERLADGRGRPTPWEAR
jgi:glycosyltransferase involved in cell wall biosynthesis